MSFHHHISELHQFLLGTQSHLCDRLSLEQDNAFHTTSRLHERHHSHIALIEDAVIERGAINVSAIHGHTLPQAASERHPECIGHSFEVTGLSMIMHPRNPHAPTMHANLRMFVGGPEKSVRWIGGGMDLTPYYAYEEDIIHWHKTISKCCDGFGEDLYPAFKKECDSYFYLPHRKEHRGVGGIFFDDVSWPYAKAKGFIEALAQCIEQAYIPLLTKRYTAPYTAAQKSFQLMRRGRYVEFNLMYDRGTRFGLEFGSQPDQILVSLPPAQWHYDFAITPGSHEDKLSTYLQPQEWLNYELSSA